MSECQNVSMSYAGHQSRPMQSPAQTTGVPLFKGCGSSGFTWVVTGAAVVRDQPCRRGRGETEERRRTRLVMAGCQTPELRIPPEMEGRRLTGDRGQGYLGTNYVGALTSRQVRPLSLPSAARGRSQPGLCSHPNPPIRAGKVLLFFDFTSTIPDQSSALAFVPTTTSMSQSVPSSRSGPVITADVLGLINLNLDARRIFLFFFS